MAWFSLMFEIKSGLITFDNDLTSFKIVVKLSLTSFIFSGLSATL